MPRWRLVGVQLEFCNCAPGCACNFNGLPNSPEGNCEGWGVDVFEDGSVFETVSLANTRVAWALWWPGAIHEGGGRGHAFVDCETDQQFDALARIYRGREGSTYFEIFRSTLTEETAVERSRVEVFLDGRRSRFSVAGVGEGEMEPLRDPVSGDEHEVHVVVPNGFIWKDGNVAQGRVMRAALPRISFDHAGRHAVVARIDWSNE